MQNKLNSEILFFVFGALLCLLPCLGLAFFWEDQALILQSISELFPERAWLEGPAGQGVSLPLLLVRQQYLVQFSQVAAWPSQVYLIFALTGLIFLLLALKTWANLSWKMLGLGLGLWLLLVLFKAWPLELGLCWIMASKGALYIGLFSLGVLGLLAASSLPHLLLQIGLAQNIHASKQNYRNFYLLYLALLGLELYRDFNGESLPAAMMLLLLGMQWSIFWFQISSFESQVSLRRAYLGLYLLAIPCLVWCIWHQNDPTLRLVYVWNLRCAGLMALLFPIFIYGNFKDIFSKNLALYRVVFKAKTLSLSSLRWGVLILGLGWAFTQESRLYHLLMASYYNQVGDLESMGRPSALAKISFQLAHAHSRLNQKSNMALAKLSSSEEEKAQFLTYTLSKHPHPNTYLFLGQLYKNNDQAFRALFTFQQGLEKFPEDPPLATALAVQWEALKQGPSALKQYRKVAGLKPKDGLLESNRLYAELRYAKSLPTILDQPFEDMGYQANRLALKLKQGAKVDGSLNKDFVFHHEVAHAAYVYHAQLWFKHLLPQDWISKALAMDAKQGAFPELNLARAWQWYQQGKVLDALDFLSLKIAQDSGAQSEDYKNLLAYYLDQQDRAQASPPISNAKQAQKALATQPFSLDLLHKALPLLNQAGQQDLAYRHALAALKYHEQTPAYYVIYAFQALEMSESIYAQEAMQSLLRIDPKLYRKEYPRFKAALSKVRERQRFF